MIMMSQNMTPISDERLVYESDLASAFGHPLRLRILRRLCCQSCCVNDLVELADVDQPKVSRHLAVLRNLKIVACEVDGRRRCYSLLKPDLVREIIAALDAVPNDGQPQNSAPLPG